MEEGSKKEGRREGEKDRRNVIPPHTNAHTQTHTQTHTHISGYIGTENILCWEQLSRSRGKDTPISQLA